VNTGNNDEKWLQVSLVPVNDTNGEIAKVLLIAYDITSEVHLAIEVQQKEETIRKQEELIQQKEVEQNKKLRETREEITNQYRETEKIKVRNEKLLEELSEAIVTTDHDGLILFMNKAAENLFTVKHDEVANQNVRILFSDTVKDNFVTTYLDPARKKIVGQRQMVTLNPRKGKEVNATMVVYEVKTGREITYTAFFQPTTNS
ncbi:MAG TPA: PAS domain S-box protein, partial [Tenuifilaceae bacterium]|nr:PAS domain S-box protein [Tenuifilaceae bacterium]